MRKKQTASDIAKLARAALAKCERPDCGEAFIKRFERHIYCCTCCRVVMWNRAQRQAA